MKHRKIRTLHLTFENQPLQLHYPHINEFRQSVLQCVRGRFSIWDNRLPQMTGHGKSENNFEYAAIHYRSQDQQALLFGVEQGLLALQTKRPALELAFGESQATEQKQDLGECQELRHYRIEHYCPYHQNQVQQFKAITTQEDELLLLRQCLRTHLGSLLRAFGLALPASLEVEFAKPPQYLGRKPITFNRQTVGIYTYGIEFVCNLNLPTGIAIGEFYSKGTGVVEL